MHPRARRGDQPEAGKTSLKNWRRVETLMESETNRTVALGAFDPKHVEADATTIGSIFGIEIPTVDASFTNDLLDPAIRLP